MTKIQTIALSGCVLLSACGESAEVLDRPRGRIEGVVLLDEAPVPCRSGTPAGQIVFELFLERELPEPMGPAHEPVQVEVVPAAEVFGASDCGEAAPRQHSGVFAIPDVGPEPGSTEGESFVLRAMYDVDGDYDLTRRFTRTPTRRDVIGGALGDAESSVRPFVPIRFDPPEAFARGQTVAGVTVTLREVVSTEPPASQLEARPMSSEAVVPATPDAVARERMIWELSGAKLRSLWPDHAVGLAGAGLALENDPLANAWSVSAIDADLDGEQDQHPLLGSAGFPWFAPTVVLERRRTEAERTAGVPRVETIASVRPTRILTKQVFAPSLEVMVAPRVDLLLDPAEELCRIPMVAPGNVTDTLERIPTDCQELPTGAYDVRVYHGVAGAVRESTLDILSDVGERWVDGGAPARWMQAWRLPNELSLPGQGDFFWIVDPDPATGRDRAAACHEALDPATGATRPVTYMPVPDRCCEPVRHLCDLPLCEAQDVGGHTVRTLETLNEDGTPPCVPFHVPQSCCTR